jgi:hypothetical protein
LDVYLRNFLFFYFNFLACTCRSKLDIARNQKKVSDSEEKKVAFIFSQL